MKSSTTLALTTLALLAQLAAAQPHRRHAHANKHFKKDVDVVLTVTNTVYATPTDGPDVIVWVDGNNVPYSTTTEGVADEHAWSTAHGALPTQAPPAPVPTSSSSAATTLATLPSAPAPPPPPPATTAPVVAPIAAVQIAAVPTSSVAPVAPAPPAANKNKAPPAFIPVENKAPPPPPATSAPAPAPAPSNAAPAPAPAAPAGNGLSYSPYNADRTCKTQDQVTQDFDAIGSGYAFVRIYGTDCNQVTTVLNAAKKHGMQLFAGVYDLNPANVASQVKTIVAAAKGDWSAFHTVSVGNEAVNSGSFSPAAVLSAMGTVRSLLKAAGYSGNVVTVDTLVALRANPQLCDASDYCAANCHPFFDGNVAAEDAGKFLADQIPTLKAVLANKNQRIVITETGWPAAGGSNQKAIPSSSNQAAALRSIKNQFTSNPGDLVLFTPFNDMWKVNTASTFNAEQFWGFLGNSPSG